MAGLIKFGNKAFLEVNDIVEVETFTLDSNKVIYKCLKTACEGDHTLESVDLPTLISAATDIGVKQLLDDRDERNYIRALTNFPVDFNTIRKMAQRIKKLNIAHSLSNVIYDCGHELQGITGQETLSEIISIPETAIFNFSSKIALGDNNEPQRIGNNIEEYYDYLSNNPVQYIGIDSGFPLYNRSIGGGFRRKTLSLVVARLKVGKSFFGSNVGAYVSGHSNIPVLYLDTEMGGSDANNRLLSIFSGVLLDEIETGAFAINDWKRTQVKKAARTISNIPYYYMNVAGKGFDEIVSLMRRWVVKEVGRDENGNTNDCLIIYDYIKILGSDGLKGAEEYQQLGFMTTKLTDFAQQYDVPVLSFSQINRDGIDKETTDIVSGSDRLAWFASNVTLFKRKSDEEIAEDGPDKGNRKLVNLATRYGKESDPYNYICVKADYHVAKLRELGFKKDLIKESQAPKNDVPDNIEPVDF